MLSCGTKSLQLRKVFKNVIKLYITNIIEVLQGANSCIRGLDICIEGDIIFPFSVSADTTNSTNLFTKQQVTGQYRHVSATFFKELHYALQIITGSCHFGKVSYVKTPSFTIRP